MNPKEKQALKEWYDEIRPELQVVLEDTHHIRTSIITVAQSHSLTKDQARALEHEVVLVLLELRPYTNLLANIEVALGVDRTVANTVYSDLELLIFSGLENALAASAADQEKLSMVTNPDITNTQNQDYLTKDKLLNSLKKREEATSYSAQAQDTTHRARIAEPFSPSGPRKAEFEKPDAVKRGYGDTDEVIEKNLIPSYKKPLTQTPTYRDPYGGDTR